jgi:hypothetical protein
MDSTAIEQQTTIEHQVQQTTEHQAQQTTEHQVQQTTEHQVQQTTVEKQVDDDGFTRVVRKKHGLMTITSKVAMDEFKGMFSQKLISFYDKKGRIIEFDNEGVCRRYTTEVSDSNGKTRTKYYVMIKTYISLMGDMVVFTWDNNEVTFTTKLNHPDLENWGGKMFLQAKKN